MSNALESKRIAFFRLFLQKIQMLCFECQIETKEEEEEERNSVHLPINYGMYFL